MYTAGYVVSALLYIPGFDVYRIVFDIMHTLELGIHQYAAASTMVELTEPIDQGGIFEGESREARFNNAYLAYDAWVDRNRLPMRAKKFQWKQWVPKKSDKFPVISQQVMKAAVLRSFTYFLEEVCCRARAVATERGCTRAVMWREFAAGDRVMRRAGKFLKADEREALMNHFENALISYNALAVESAAAGVKLYPVVPKHHAMVHIAFDFSLNPRRTSCYLDEDMVGRCKRLYNGCYGGHTAPKRSLQRYIIMIGLRWTAAIRRLRLARVRGVRHRA
jgi:hypothetical protein